MPYSTLRVKKNHYLSEFLRFQTAIHLRMEHSRLNMQFSISSVFPVYYHALNLRACAPFIGEWQFSRYGRDISLIYFNGLFSSFQGLPLQLFPRCFAPLEFSESQIIIPTCHTDFCDISLFPCDYAKVSFDVITQQLPSFLLT
jgi:hypothetical protein